MIATFDFFEFTASDIAQAVIILVGATVLVQKMRDKLRELESRVALNSKAVQNMDTTKRNTEVLEEFARECSRKQEQRHTDFEKFFREISERTARIEGKLDRMDGRPPGR